VPDAHVERVVYAAEHGSIYLTLLPPDPKQVRTQGGVTVDNVVPQAQ
jgi:hypothetical protein